MLRKAARSASALTTSSQRYFSAPCDRPGLFHGNVKSNTRPLQPVSPDALMNRSTPEVTAPIWRVPPFSFVRFQLPVGAKRGPPYISYEHGKSPTLFHYFYEPAYKLGYVGNEILMNYDHPLHIRMRRKYEATEKDCLWWAALTNLKTSPKRFIRDEMNRRLRAAFRAALAERGFDASGRKVVNGKVESQGTFKGTLNLVCRPELLRATPEDMKKEALWTVDALVRLFEGQKKQPKSTPKERSREMDPTRAQTKPHKIYRRNL